MNLDE